MKKSIANKVFDEMIEQGVKEYEEEQANTEYEKFEFSETHQQKMNELFAEAAKKEKKIKQMRTIRKVAAIILIAVVTLGVCAPHISAWREKIEEFFMKDKEKYSLVGYGDVRDSDKMITVQKDYMYDISFLGYIPEGFEVDRYSVNSKNLLVKIVNENKYIVFSMDKTLERALDSEEIEYIHETINNHDVLFHYKDGRNAYVLNLAEGVFDILGNISKEELIKVIEKIDLGKLEELLQ